MENILFTLDGKPLPEPTLSAAKAAYEAAKKCQTIDELRTAIEAFDGCALKKVALNTVLADGVFGADLMVVGEAPGAQEDEQGKPFVGRSGQLLDKMLEAIGHTRAKNTYITNGLFWRPPENRTPTPLELATVRPFVEKHFALAKPKVILFVGASSAKFMLRTKTGITKLRGNWLTYQNEFMDKPVPVICSFHPAYLLRNPPAKKEAWEDLKMVRDKLST